MTYEEKLEAVATILAREWIKTTTHGVTGWSDLKSEQQAQLIQYHKDTARQILKAIDNNE